MCKAIHKQSKHSGAEEMPNVGGGIIEVMTNLRELSAEMSLSQVLEGCLSHLSVKGGGKW